jgi:hypothetical protein
MSQLKVDTITDEAGTGSPSLPNGLTVGGVNYPSTGPLSNRNKIINGAMVIDQRNAGASVAFTITGYGTVDRIRAILTGAPGAYSLQQVSDAPNGFSKSLRLTVTSTDATPTGSRQYGLQQRVEGFNTADFNFGSSGASAVTLSFWVKCSVTGTFGGVIQNSASNRSYAFSFSVVAANTWEYKTVTIDGDTTGTWLTDNGSGLFLQFTVGADSAVLTTPNVWSAANFKGPTGQTNLMATNGATFQITGVQLEAGTVATPFEHRSFGQELALCKRYFSRITGNNVAFASGSAGSTTNTQFYVVYPQTMRAAPTISLSSTQVTDFQAAQTATAINTTFAGLSSAQISVTSSSLTQYRPYLLTGTSASAYIEYSSEL